MSSRFRVSLVALALLGACDREERAPRGAPLPETGPLLATARSGTLGDPRSGDYEGNAYQVSQGQLYFTWMNCNGCHANGGGGMGPALNDSEWRYGGSIEQIAATIIEGRPNGMPSFAGKMTAQQVWQVAAFVRSLSAHVRQDARAGRTEGLSQGEPSTLRDPQPIERVTPKQDEATVR